MTMQLDCVRSRFQWPAAKIDLLRELWPQEELSVTIIARRLGMTRNAVVGKRRRLGLPERITGFPTQEAARDPTPRKRKHTATGQGRRKGADGGLQQAVTRRRAKPDWRDPEFRCDAATDLLPDQSDCAVSLLELGEIRVEHCRWPLGQHPQVTFCGANPFPGMPYCGRHCAIAYKPSSRAE